MPKTFYLADWHYGHANILAYDDRPFRTVDEMNAALVDRWNHAVSPDDFVYILGDMFWCGQRDAIPILDALHGRKVLVRGNHDRVGDDFSRRFLKICDYLEVEDDGRHIVLCHYPIPCFKNHTLPSWFHFYGHVHNSFEWKMTEHSARLMRDLYMRPCTMINVGVMMPWMDYTPRTFSEILHGAAAYDRQTEKE